MGLMDATDYRLNQIQKNFFTVLLVYDNLTVKMVCTDCYRIKYTQILELFQEIVSSDKKNLV